MGKKVCVVGAGYWGKNHINTLQYISRQNYNDEFLLGLATQYVYSIKQIDNKNKYAADIEKSILLSKNTRGQFILVLYYQNRLQIITDRLGYFPLYYFQKVFLLTVLVNLY